MERACSTATDWSLLQRRLAVRDLEPPAIERAFSCGPSQTKSVSNERTADRCIALDSLCGCCFHGVQLLLRHAEFRLLVYGVPQYAMGNRRVTHSKRGEGKRATLYSQKSLNAPPLCRPELPAQERPDGGPCLGGAPHAHLLQRQVWVGRAFYFGLF